ncbi:MAG: tetratricopeptide repeat protein [Acidobacteriota bacterium]
MRKTIYTIIFITLFINLSFAQGTTVWLNGSKTDSLIINQKSQFEAKGIKVFINDADGRVKRHSIKQVDSGDEKFDRIFREGRELIDKEDWAKAAAKFNEIVCDCPENKQVDAAFYWLAFCYNKQKMVKEARATVERLLKNFPDSSWADDARVLNYQIGSSRLIESRTATGQNIYSTVTPRALAPGQTKTLTTEVVAGNYLFGQEIQLDREDEIKLAAFQSLMVADPKKGIEAVGNILRSDSKASEILKLQILRTLRTSRYWTTRSVGSYSGTYEITPTTAVTQINPLLRETLVKGYQTEATSKIRAEIIYSIAGINDEQSINYLAQLYSNESNKELKMTIINSFGSASNTLFGYAYYPFSTAGKAEVELATVATNMATTASIAPSAQASASKSTDTNPIRKLRFDKLMEIFRSEKDLELKRTAFSNLQRFVGWSNTDGVVGMLSQMYDAENDEKFKSSIIVSFSGLNKNTQATNKLLDIAKNDKSDKMRLEAIRALRNNNSPEVIKFLEDLIR